MENSASEPDMVRGLPFISVRAYNNIFVLLLIAFVDNIIYIPRQSEPKSWDHDY